MKTNKSLLLAAVCCFTFASHSGAAVLKHPKMRMLDSLFAQSPFMLEELVGMKKVIIKVEADVATFKTTGQEGVLEDEFVTSACEELLDTTRDFLAYIYDFQTVVEPLVRESLSPLTEEGIDPKDAFFLYRFFDVTRDNVPTYFEDHTHSLDDLVEVLDEFSLLSSDLLDSCSRSTKKNYLQWKKEQKASA